MPEMTMTNANTNLTAFVIKYISSYGDSTSVDNVMVSFDEKEAVDMAAKLNASVIGISYEFCYYEIEQLSNQPRNLGTNHRDPHFVEIALRQIAHPELMRNIHIDGRFSREEGWTWLDVALDNLHSRCSGCPEMTLARVTEIILDEVRDGINVSHWHDSYQEEQARHDQLAASVGLRIIA
ncbi:hypothetical protein D3C79_37150 [compost metagenome]